MTRPTCATCGHRLSRHTTWANGQPGIVCTVDNCHWWHQCGDGGKA